MIKTKYIEDNELPYSIQIDNLQGAGRSPAGATIAALRVGCVIPAGCKDRGEAANYLFFFYNYPAYRTVLIHILEKNTFDQCPHCDSYNVEYSNYGWFCRDCDEQWDQYGQDTKQEGVRNNARGTSYQDKMPVVWPGRVDTWTVGAESIQTYVLLC